MKSRLVRLLNEGTGTRWRTESGKHGSICYFTCSATCSDLPKSLFPKDGTARTGDPKPISEHTCSPVLSPLGENGEQVCEGREVRLPSCPHCRGFAIYPQADGKHSCMTCKQTW
jgi:hypothetical protein